MKNRQLWTPSKYVVKNGKLIASRNTEEVKVASRLMADLIAAHYDEHLRIHAHGKLLDLGCGKVPLYGAYKDHVTENTCVDWENTLHKNSYLDFECNLTETLPFEDNQFDTIILSDVLEHIPEPEKLLAEIARILSNNGKILLNVPFYYWLHEQPHDFYRYTEFALRRFVQNSGLELILLKSIGGAPEIMTDIFSKNVLRVPVLGHPMASFAQWFTYCFVRTSVGNRVSNKTGKSFPFGYFLIAKKTQSTA